MLTDSPLVGVRLFRAVDSAKQTWNSTYDSPSFLYHPVDTEGSKSRNAQPWFTGYNSVAFFLETVVNYMVQWTSKTLVPPTFDWIWSLTKYLFTKLQQQEAETAMINDGRMGKKNDRFDEPQPVFKSNKERGYVGYMKVLKNECVQPSYQKSVMKKSS